MTDRGLRLSAGEPAYLDDEPCAIVAVLDLERVIVELGEDKVRQTVLVSALRTRPKQHGNERGGVDLDHIPPEVWTIAEQRLDVIRPLLNLAKRTKALVRDRADELGMSYGPLYIWIRRYEATELLSSLLPLERSGGRGRSRLSPQRETLLHQTIESHFLNKLKLTPQNVHRELKVRAFEAGVKSPSVQTVRSRIGMIDASLLVKRRHGSKALQKLQPTVGRFPEVASPYDVVQIDHTILDVQLVDEQYRKPIGRAHITVAIDVFSRMVAGFYVSLDPSGDLSTGLCLVHTILPKKPWLEKSAPPTDVVDQNLFEVRLSRLDSPKEITQSASSSQRKSALPVVNKPLNDTQSL